MTLPADLSAVAPDKRCCELPRAGPHRCYRVGKGNMQPVRHNGDHVVLAVERPAAIGPRMAKHAGKHVSEGLLAQVTGLQ